MAIGIRGRILYSFLVSLTFILSLSVTIIFEMKSVKQTIISVQSQNLLTILILIRITNYMFTLLTFCMTITTFTHGSDEPVVPFGLANATCMFAIFLLFFVLEFTLASERYEMVTLKTFNLRDKESRDATSDQLAFLDAFQASHQCCGLTGYEDYSKTNSKFSTNTALGDDEDTDDGYVIDNTLTWGDFLTGTKVYYTSSGKCGRNQTKLFDFKPSALASSGGDIPKSCCISPSEPTCNQNIFKNSTRTTLTNINTEGCNVQLLEAIREVNTPMIRLLLFVYPWLVSIFSMIVTWALTCQVRGVPFKMFGIYICRKPRPQRAVPETKFETDVGSPMSDESETSAAASPIQIRSFLELVKEASAAVEA